MEDKILNNIQGGGSAKLAISIPTFNREPYLDEILTSVNKNFIRNPELKERVKVYVTDNNSTDNTKAVIEKHNKNFHIEYSKNDENIGLDRNIHIAYTKPVEDYVWVIGDDEIFHDNAFEEIFKVIDEYDPGLIITLETFKELTSFKKYKDVIKHFNKLNQTPIGHSLISFNIMKTKAYNAEEDIKWMHERYGMFHGMVNDIDNFPPIICMPQVITVREQRAAFAEGYPTDILKIHILLKKWMEKKFKTKVLYHYQRRVKLNILGIKISYIERK